MTPDEMIQKLEECAKRRHPGLRWHRHPVSGKWHAFTAKRPKALCRSTTHRDGVAKDTIPWGETCWSCLHACGIHEGPQPQPQRIVVEEMRARFEGGPFDGETLLLRVVRTSPVEHVVLEQAYDRTVVAAKPDPTTTAVPQ